MSKWSDIFSRSPASRELQSYKSIRAAGKTWFEKIMSTEASKKLNIVSAAKKLTLPVEGRTIIFDNEDESSVLMDYFLFEYRPDGQSLIETCTPAPVELTALERDWHEAVRTSGTSLFEVTAVQEGASRVILRDRLAKEASEIWLTDVGLSDSFRRMGGKALIFTRVMSLHNLHMTGGYSFVFEPKEEFRLVDGYRRLMWKVPPARQSERRLIYFFQMNQRHGLEHGYADVTP